MKRLALLALLLITNALPAAEKDTMLYEIRTYWPAEGKMDALHARFKDHTIKLFEKHGMMNICYWVPLDETDKRLIYVLAHKDKAAAAASWKAFAADPDWKSAQKASEVNGKLVTKAQSIYLNKTDFSPTAHGDSSAPHIFELRTYVTTPKNLDAIQSRFRDHTVKLFEKQGMTNVAYCTIADTDKVTNGKMLAALTAVGDEKCECKMDDEAKSTALIYVLSHKSKDAAKASFDAFRADPVWIAAKAESEKKAGGSLTVKDGVKSLFLKTTDYSPNK
ncbi:hypothetical protein BH11PLA2_BH11PLA2_33710 [soil metagenome]